MRYFRSSYLVLACLLGFVGNANGANPFTINPSTRQDLGTVYVNETIYRTVVITNVSGSDDSFKNANMNYGSLEINSVKVGLAASLGVSVTAPGGSPIAMTEYTQNINSVDEIWVKSAFSVPIVNNGTATFELAITPKVAGLYNEGLISFSQSVALGESPSYEFTFKAENRPATPAPAKPKPIPSFVSFFLDQPDLSGVTIRVPAHLNWGGDSPRWELDPDYSKITWYRNGQVIATGKDPWLELADGDTVSADAPGTDGVVRTPDPNVPYIFRVPSSAAVQAYDPGESGYHPKPEPRKTNQASVLRTTEGQGPVGAIDNNRVWPAAPPRAKPTGLQPATWGQVKASRAETEE